MRESWKIVLEKLMTRILINYIPFMEKAIWIVQNTLPPQLSSHACFNKICCNITLPFTPNYIINLSKFLIKILYALLTSPCVLILNYLHLRLFNIQKTPREEQKINSIHYFIFSNPLLLLLKSHTLVGIYHINFDKYVKPHY
jgi:hypothetical protein